MKVLLALFSLLLLAGCQSIDQLRSDDADLYQPPEPDYEMPQAQAGGLFRTGYSRPLVSDRRAVRVGDIITVVLEESTQSSKSAGTSFGKSTSVGIDAPVLFGSAVDDLASSAGAQRKFDGSARSSQQNTLRGSIAVTVHKVLPGGNLLVRGEKSLRLNQGDEIIRLTGLVRVDDINRFNQVSSQNVANARISYAGRGALADSNSPGWLTRFFTSPLFPL